MEKFIIFYSTLSSDDQLGLILFTLLLLSLSILIILCVLADIDAALSEITEQEYISLKHNITNLFFYYQSEALINKYMKKGYIRRYQLKKIYNLNSKIDNENNMQQARDLLKSE